MSSFGSAGAAAGRVVVVGGGLGGLAAAIAAAEQGLDSGCSLSRATAFGHLAARDVAAAFTLR
jgi:succinate dehydrogenase/fumarate reductase flavoprotein subunit